MNLLRPVAFATRQGSVEKITYGELGVFRLGKIMNICVRDVWQPAQAMRLRGFII